MLRTHFSREDRTEWERYVDAACVLLEWDGHPYVPMKKVGQTVPKEGAPRGVRPGDYLVDKCRERLARSLTYREQRGVRSQAFAQIQEYRANLRSADWSSSGDGKHKLIARRVARNLLDPGVTWDELTPTNTSGGTKNRYDDYRSIRRACANFAILANLILPQKRSGRLTASRNIAR